MYGYEPRDKSGPMDLDPPTYDTTRLDAFNLPLQDDGPARKRLHSELEPRVPFHAQPSPGFASYNHAQNTAPLLLAALNTPKRAPAYDPSQWYSAAPRTPATSNLMTQEVEMDSPARQPPTASSSSTPIPATKTTEAASERANTAEDKENSDDKEVEKDKPRKFAKGAVTRTNKKRQQARKEREQRSEGEDNAAPVRHSDSVAGPSTWSKAEHHYNVHMNAPALRHSEIPALLLGYLQFFVNTSIVVFCVYLAVLFVLTVRRDVKDKMQEYSVEILQEIAECTNLYLTNRCDPTFRVPAMEAPCKAWDACMNRDPTMVGRINIIAETFAGVINSFVEPISWKTMSFTLVTLTFLIALTNSALFNLRARASHHEPITPPTPQGYWPPHGQFMPQLPPHIPQGHMLAHDQMPSGDGSKQIGWTGEQEQKKGWW
ncbi:hypothetical protein CI109_104791 [Kwoniella shandongensis]|uniref:Uncharacterized protein n=1 Tax=Kwoniella shandongensis TaxID=1734106 RepID=A0A5M6BPG2_9TREE|nr:uncharacterized protein CI109_006876 [Kwoniella shandongensis]KAA5524788.1 hypothetical protein CI109_006876 [Kwoniella shandongensis]